MFAKGFFIPIHLGPKYPSSFSLPITSLTTFAASELLMKDATCFVFSTTNSVVSVMKFHTFSIKLGPPPNNLPCFDKKINLSIAASNLSTSNPSFFLAINFLGSGFSSPSSPSSPSFGFSCCGSSFFFEPISDSCFDVTFLLSSALSLTFFNPSSTFSFSAFRSFLMARSSPPYC